MADTTALPPLTTQHLHTCTVDGLQALAWQYFRDEDAAARIAAELENRGIDPYA